MSFSFKLVLGRVTNLAQVQVGAQMPQFEDQVLSLETTDLSVQEGEHVVVGSSGAGNGDQSVIVVVSVRQAGK
jgi:predicted ABC-type transport system involved in lysophospholipase L1 biosynthesis ATPase subunit